MTPVPPPCSPQAPGRSGARSAPTILLAIPKGPARAIWRAFFEARGWHVLMLDRETVGPRCRVVLHDDRVVLDGTPVRAACRAVLLDSGYMWQIPVLTPDEHTWHAYRNRFDDLLRNERESRAFWYSLLEILNDILPACINRQRAFAHEAMTPAALQRLADNGVPIAPFLVSNDPGALSRFRNAAPHILSRDVLPTTPFDAAFARTLEVGREEGPIQFLQGVDDPRQTSIWVVGGHAVHTERTDPTGGNTENLPADKDIEGWAATHLDTVMKTLDLELATISLARHEGEFVLTGFSPSPDVSKLPPRVAERTLEAVLHRLEEMAP